MRRTLHGPYSPRRQRTHDTSVLGDDALARATRQVEVAVDRCMAVWALLAAGVLATAEDLATGPPLVIASAGVLLVLLIGLGAATTERDRRALQLIGEGSGDLPHRSVARLRRRLLDPVQRERLARSLELMCVEAERPPAQCHSIRPYYKVRVVRAVSCELAEVATLLRAGGGLRGLAWAELLVTDGCSPLYGSSEAALREELRRIRFLLSS